MQVTWQPAAPGVYPAKPTIPVQESVKAAKVEEGVDTRFFWVIMVTHGFLEVPNGSLE